MFFFVYREVRFREVEKESMYILSIFFRCKMFLFLVFCIEYRNSFFVLYTRILRERRS